MNAYNGLGEERSVIVCTFSMHTMLVIKYVEI